MRLRLLLVGRFLLLLQILHQILPDFLVVDVILLPIRLDDRLLCLILLCDFLASLDCGVLSMQFRPCLESLRLTLRYLLS